LGQATRALPPPPYILLKRTPRFAYGTPSHVLPPTLSPDASPPHSPRQPGPGSCHLPCQHPPPSGTPLPVPLDAAVTPPRLSGRKFFRNQKQARAEPRPGSRPLPSRTPDHNHRRGVHPIHSLRNRPWHSGHRHPTRHRQHPAL